MAIERNGDAFTVPADLLAEALGLTQDALRQAMRDGDITTRTERGEGADAGRWRLTFIHGAHACRFTVDQAGNLLGRSSFPITPRS